MDQTRADRAVEARHQELRRWRRVQAMGGFILLCSFFLPAVDACNCPFVPAGEVLGFLREGTTDLREWAWLFVICIASYLYGLLTLVISLRRRRRPVAAERKAGVSVAVLLGAVVAVVLIAVTIDAPGSLAPPDLGGGISVTILLISCAYWLRSVRMGAGGMLCVRWYTALCCIAWFGLWSSTSDARYGVWISLAGSVVIAVGCTQEARLRSRRTAWDCARGLLTGRLALFDLDGPRCQRCGYLLFGLTVPRCPECGHEFSWAEYGLAPAPPNGDPDAPRARL